MATGRVHKHLYYAWLMAENWKMELTALQFIRPGQ